jgi:hypothetical protein
MTSRVNGPITVAIVDDYDVVMMGLANMFDQYSDRVVVAELDSNEALVDTVDIALRGEESSVRRRSPTLARSSSSARSPASSAVRIRARSRCIQSLRRRGCGSARRAPSTQQGGHRIGRQCFGQCLGQFGPSDHRHRVGRDQLRGVQKGTRFQQ